MLRNFTIPFPLSSLLLPDFLFNSVRRYTKLTTC